ncbi:T9SS type A sorting domain-containing protein [Flavobacterium gelatinilyticum]|uniref:T9SS type A sorting domain-containing protein n=1 Tax=Flavobacterium gelatinilyticum TaxID=3003260 RepID=UPI00247FA5C9|nr:T9SS type A sorting domain-containing protein [Flavobacterium gelatinilyticum]
MKKTLLFFCLLHSLLIFSQNAADVDHNFGPGPGFGGKVYNMVVQPDGKIIVQGSRIYKNAVTKEVIRLNPDGSVDTSFNYNPGTDFNIKCLAVQPDGKLLIGGSNLAETIRIIRLNEDGSRDTAFDSGNSRLSNIFVNSLAVQSDGKIMISYGGFRSFGPYKSVYRLNADGSSDGSFNIGTGFDYGVTKVAVQADGKIIVTGDFTTFNGVKQNHVVRLNTDGSKDSSFDIGTGFNNDVDAIVIQNDGKILLGGAFKKFQDADQRYLIRLNPDGSKDTSFITPDGFKYFTYQTVTNMCLLADGRLLASFYISNGDSYGDDSVRCFNPDGSFDTAFPSTFFNDGANLLTGKMNADVLSIVELKDGRMLIGGTFNYCRRTIEKGIICLNPDGTKNAAFSKDTGFDAAVYCSALQPDGKVIVGGYFDNFQGVIQKKLIRLNADGTRDTSFKLNIEFNDEVQSILIQPDGKILVKGKFTDYEAQGRSYLVRLNPDGSLDTGFSKRFGSPLEAIAIQPDGKIIVEGFFSSFPNADVRKIMRFDSDGFADSSFKPGDYENFNGVVTDIAVQPDGKILVGGNFTIFNSASQKYLLRLNADGSKDTSFSTEALPELAIVVGNIVVQPDGKIIVGGVFSPAAGNYESFLMRLNADGTKDASFTDGNWYDKNRTGYGISINAVQLQKDGKIIVGGEFDTFNETALNRLARLNPDGTVDSTFDAGTGFGAPVQTLSVYPDGKILAGGTFSGYRGVASSSYLIRLNGTAVTPSVDAVTIQTNLTCPGSSSGSASIVSVFNGQEPYTYLWSNGEKTASITGLAEGNYSCTITDAAAASVTKNFIIIADTDFEKPRITAPTALTVNTDTDCTAVNVDLGIPVTSDNCSVASVTNDAPASFPIGKTTVTWTVKDGSNNTAIATQIVTVNGLNAGITYTAGKLSAAETGGTYKWLTCKDGESTVIPNETNAVFTPKTSGSYAVEVTKNGCTVTSTCFEVTTLGTKDFDLQNALKVYPNPVNDFITIETNASAGINLNIYDVTSHNVLSKEIKTTSAKLNISHLPKGVYMFQFSNETGNSVRKVIKN